MSGIGPVASEDWNQSSLRRSHGGDLILNRVMSYLLLHGKGTQKLSIVPGSSVNATLIADECLRPTSAASISDRFTNLPLIRGRVSAYAFRDAYLIVFPNRRHFLFSRYRITLAFRSTALPPPPPATSTVAPLAPPPFPSGTTPNSENETCADRHTGIKSRNVAGLGSDQVELQDAIGGEERPGRRRTAVPHGSFGVDRYDAVSLLGSRVHRGGILQIQE
ncbi:hypothetical protein MUK42_35130 [Musa troglodytarum]|uniref:Uncharacterized protein n=1 Tax=Musa troglodytarum TaxID=320322 RepID=A0A9E7F9G6_9LILI|nr:hypothetical protein MUK42_35130 [Musa troglodytarum]